MHPMSWIRTLTITASACALTLAAHSGLAHANAGACNHDHEDDESSAARSVATRRVSWSKPSPGKHVERVQLLGINDFHGQLSTGRLVAGRPVGSAAVLAAYLKAEQASFNGPTAIVHAGDHVGASPAASALLQDEPSIQFLNMLGSRFCGPKNRTNPLCNVVGTLGNHEFDEGVDELLRLIRGGNHATGPFLQEPYKGTSFPYVCANVVRRDSGKPILPPYVIQQLGAARVAFIGAVLEGTPSIVTPTGVAGVQFLDEADAINSYIPELRKKGVEAIVVLIHEGGRQTSYEGTTSATAGAISGEIVNIVARLDGAVDVVVSGHAHSFSNGLLPNAAAQPTLVTQAFSSGTAYGDIELTIDLATRDVVAKSAAIVTTWADAGPGLAPDAAIAALTAEAEAVVAPLVNEEVGVAASDITRLENAAGESALGNLIADSQRAAMNTDIAFMNPGGIRADVFAGELTWGELFTVQPFGNSLTRMSLTGAQIVAVLEQQWAGQPFARILKTSGLSYTWDAAAPVGNRIVSVQIGGALLDPAATYSVTANSFIAAGGDNFTTFNLGTDRQGGPVDLDALIDYVQTLSQPFSAAIEGRITRLN